MQVSPSELVSASIWWVAPGVVALTMAVASAADVMAAVPLKSADCPLAWFGDLVAMSMFSTSSKVGNRDNAASESFASGEEIVSSGFATTAEFVHTSNVPATSEELQKDAWQGLTLTRIWPWCCAFLLASALMVVWDMPATIWK
jgi:hypothetical protein